MGTAGSSSAPSVTNAGPLRRAKVLYDFEASESNELALRAGERVEVLDDTDSNWWKGRNAQGSQGYFPAAFVTMNLEAPAGVPADAPAANGHDHPAGSTSSSQPADDVLESPPPVSPEARLVGRTESAIQWAGSSSEGLALVLTCSCSQSKTKTTDG